MTLMVPGETAVIGTRVVKVSEMLPHSDLLAEIVTLTGDTVWVSPEHVRPYRRPTEREVRATAERIPPAMYVTTVREGYELMAGVRPVAGERVLLTRETCVDVFEPRWFLVTRVEHVYVPECARLYGFLVHSDGAVRRSVYVTVATLRVERALPACR